MISQRRQIVIKRSAPVIDGQGDASETPVEIYKGWAEVQNLSGSRRFIDRPMQTRTMQFEISNRLNQTIDTNCVIEYAGNAYRVETVNRKDEKMFFLAIIASCNVRVYS